MSWLAPDPWTHLLVQVVVVLAAIRLACAVARRLGQPAVIAEIAAGVALGPSLFGALAPDAHAALFAPGSLHALQLLSQLGLVLFMFLVGLDLDLGHLHGRRLASVGIATMAIVTPFALGVGLAAAVRDALCPAGVPFTAFALFIGSAMSITAFPVLVRILVEARLAGTSLGTLAVACAALGDLAAWCLLAVSESVARSGALTDGLITTAAAAAYVVFMLVMVRPLLARLLPTSDDRLGADRLGLLVLLVFASAWATERLGIHALFGAFLFGFALPRDRALAATITAALGELVGVVLLPLFFAVSGLRTELGLLASAEQLGLCVLVISVASLGKIGGGAGAARLTGLGWREATTLGVLLNTRGLMELVVLNLGLEVGVISPAVFAMMVVMAVVTTLATTPLVRRLAPRPA